MKVHITADVIRRLPVGPVDIWDTKTVGLVLRVRESGRASWCVVQGRGPGSKETLGAVDKLTPTQARELAAAILGQAVKDRALGEDPREARRRRRAKGKAATLRQFLKSTYEPWATTHRKSGDQTVTRVRRAFEDFMGKPLHALAPFELERWRTRRRKAGTSDATCNRDLDALRSVLSRAVEWGALTSHPMRQIRRAKLDLLGRVRYLSVDEEKRLRAALEARDESRREGRRRFNAWRAERGYKTLPDYGAYPDHVTPITLLALNTGLRRGELFALKWTDLDLVACRLTVVGATAKSGLTRYVPLNAEAASVMRAWRGCLPDDAALCFPGPQGESMFSLKTSWSKVVKAAGIADFTFHDCRHSFASRLVQAGVDLNTVRELLGHGDIRMTLRYSHLAPENKAAAVAKLGTPRA